MSPDITLVIIYCVLILLASLAGGWIPLIARFTHTGTQLLMSAVAGLMLGVGVFHMLPHANMQTHSLDRTVWWLMIGLLTMFFLQRFFHFHQHGPAEYEDDEHGDESGHEHDSALDHDPQHVHGPECQHDHGHAHEHEHDHVHGGDFSWLGIFIGLTIHTLLDGIALAASVEVDFKAAPTGWLFGLATFLAVVLHKPLDAMAITSLMIASGWSPASRKLVNAAFALMVPLGVVLFYLGVKNAGTDQQTIIGCALAFSAGTFLCISLSDLLPELQFHSHDRLKLSAALLLGIAAAYAIGIFEHAGHDHHGHQHSAPSEPTGEHAH